MESLCSQVERIAKWGKRQEAFIVLGSKVDMNDWAMNAPPKDLS